MIRRMIQKILVAMIVQIALFGCSDCNQRSYDNGQTVIRNHSDFVVRFGLGTDQDKLLSSNVVTLTPGKSYTAERITGITIEYNGQMISKDAECPAEVFDCAYECGVDIENNDL